MDTGFLDEVRAFYDALAPRHHDRLGTDLSFLPVERAVLAMFADLLGPGARVLDAGCGPGRVTAHLANFGLAAEGFDLSPAMLELARTAFPDLPFRLGSLTALDAADESLNGVLCWYSLIHIPPAHRPAVLSELYRVLVPGGLALLAFQVGDDVRHVTDPDGSGIALDFYRLNPDIVRAQLAEAGFDWASLTVRPPDPGRELVPQASVIARRVQSGLGPRLP